MGDRRMAEIKTTDGSIYVYTHWRGSELPADARRAVERAKPRLGDEPYWTRIVIDELIKPGRDGELGFGIMLKPTCEDGYNHDEPSVVIDAKTGGVTVVGRDGDDQEGGGSLK